MNNFLRLTALAFLSAIFFSSCEKDDDETQCEPAVIAEKSLSLDFEFNAADAPFQYDEVYTINGIAVSFDEIRFYLSDFVLHDDAENMESIEAFLLLDAGASNNTFTIGETELDHIHELHMLLGLNDVVNHQDPIVADAPLNDASMHWGWNPDAGYKFVKVECMADTDADGTPDSAVSMHVATDALSRAVEVEVHQSGENNSNEIALTVDIEDIFENIDLSTVGTSHGGTQVNGALATNLAGAFDLVD
ncbi:MAG: MbnP family protein [Flavobacteriales bacterium]